MDAAFRVFEEKRLAELKVVGIDAEVATQIALDEWHQMDEAARAWWCNQVVSARDSADSDIVETLAIDRRASSSAASGPQDRSTSSATVEGTTVSHTTQASSVSETAGGGGTVKSRPRVSKAQVAGQQKPRRKRKAAEADDMAVERDGDGVMSAVVGSGSGPSGQCLKDPAGHGWLRLGHVTAGASSRVVGAADDEEDEEDEAEEDGLPQKQQAFKTSRVITGGASHPDWLTEPTAVAEISLPRLSEEEVVFLPSTIVTDGSLSGPQFESVAYAARRFRATLPNGMRAGYFLGDGTGCGKGRIIAALAWHLWNSGARRHLWLSASADLLADAKRDFHDIGADLPISALSRWGYGPIGAGRGLDHHGDGVLFASYQLLVATSGDAAHGEVAQTSSNSRLAQIVDWLSRAEGGARGLVALDEAHRAKNVGAPPTHAHRARSVGSRTGVCVSELQHACPGIAVLYASATGATEIRHLGYLERLGLWGPGRPHASFDELYEAVERGGLAAMELLAMTMRAEGMLSCRSLSFRGTSFRLVEVSPKGAKRAQYAAAGAFWQEAFQGLKAMVKGRQSEIKSKKLRVATTEQREMPLQFRQFWGCQQQFFRQLIMCAKVDDTVSLAQSAILREEAVVIAMWSTGESITQARLQREGVEDIGGFASAPYEIALRALQKILEPSAGDNRKAQEMVKRLRGRLEELELPPNPLDDLIQRLGGPAQVAELTGRSRRPVGVGGRLEDRGEGANLQEQQAFQSGRKRVAIITEAASAGISLHCDQRLPPDAQRPRYMITIELPWEADKAVQQLGRVHRSNQRCPPKFAVVVTDLGGEVRFVSAVARRLRILGAMMRGDRNSAHGAVESLVAFDVQNRYGRRALSRFFELLRSHGDPGVSFSFVGPGHGGKNRNCRHWNSWHRFCDDAAESLEKVGLKLDTQDKFDESLSESKNLSVFLNRILMLEPDIQNALFDAVATLYAHLVNLDRVDGTFDGGLESLDRRGRHQRASVAVTHREVLYRDPETGAATTYVRLRVDRGISWEAASEICERHCDGGPEGFYWHQTCGAERGVLLAVARPLLHGTRGLEEDDEDEQQFEIHDPQGGDPLYARGGSLRRESLRRSPFRLVGSSERGELQRVWKAQHAATQAKRYAEEHVLSGSILNTWAVVGGAVGCTSTRSGAQKRIPLVRARLADGGAVVGVRVLPEHLAEVRYALNALLEEAARRREEEAELAVPIGEVPAVLPAKGAPRVAEVPLSELSARLEEILRTQPGRCAMWHGWAGAHKALAAEGLVESGARGFESAQDAFADLERNGKLDIDEAEGTVTLREKQKGAGWYVPPPKKPKPGRRGRGRGGGCR